MLRDGDTRTVNLDSVRSWPLSVMSSCRVGDENAICLDFNAHQDRCVARRGSAPAISYMGQGISRALPARFSEWQKGLRIEFGSRAHDVGASSDALTDYSKTAGENSEQDCEQPASQKAAQSASCIGLRLSFGSPGTAQPFDRASRGSVTSTQVPRPRPSLVTDTEPWCSSTRCFTSHRPIPRPPWHRVAL